MQKVEIKPFHLIGISILTTNENSQALGDIQGLWQKFMGQNLLNKIPNKLSDEIYSLYTDYEGDHTKPYRVILGCKVSDVSKVPDAMIAQSFEGGHYVKLKVKGDLTKGVVGDKWGEIWQSDLDRVFTADFEVYGAKAMNPKDAELEICVAVK